MSDTKSEPTGGCPCIVLNAERRESFDAQHGKPIEFGPGDKETGSGSFSTLPEPSVWNGQSITIPATGLYVTMLSAHRTSGAEQDDAFLNLNLRQGANAPSVIGSAWIGENSHTAPDSGHYDRNQGVFHRVTKFDQGDEIWLTTTTDGGRHVHLAHVNWTFFHLCCDSGAGVPSPC